MRLTKQRLRVIIKEELLSTLNEASLEPKATDDPAVARMKKAALAKMATRRGGGGSGRLGPDDDEKKEARKKVADVIKEIEPSLNDTQLEKLVDSAYRGSYPKEWNDSSSFEEYTSKIIDELKEHGQAWFAPREWRKITGT